MDIKEQLLLAKEYGIKLEDVIFIELLLLAQPDEDKPELLYDYFQLDLGLRANPIESLTRIQDAGIINKSYKIPEKGSKFDPKSVEFNKVFLRKYHQWSGDLGFDLWNTYPDFANIKGFNVMLKNIAKFYHSIDEFFFAYGKAIKFRPEKHKEVIEIVNFGKEQGLLKENIAGFVINQGWEVLIRMRDQGFDGNMMNYDELL